ncbi:hypothetical protein D9M71_645090 [compost metagenome]
MQFMAVRAGRVSEYGDMRFGLTHRRVDDHFRAWNTVDGLGNGLAFGLLGQVDRLAILNLEQVALHDELAVGTGIQHAPTLELDLVQAVERAGRHAVDRHFELKLFEGLADGLLGIVGHGKAADQGKGSGENSGHAHENS